MGIDNMPSDKLQSDKLQIDMKSLKFDGLGLVPAIVQDATTREVLTLAYMNEESLSRTLQTGETWFYSRSRHTLWHKGETSGNVQQVVSISPDCDSDALLIRVIPAGPACHTGAISCFDQEGASGVSDANSFILNQLEARVAQRYQQRPEGAYTTYLFEKGIDKILKKVGEETAEVIIAAKNRSKDEVRYEVADLFYHLLVMLKEQDLPLSEVFTELSKRYEHKEGK